MKMGSYVVLVPFLLLVALGESPQSQAVAFSRNLKSRRFETEEVDLINEEAQPEGDYPVTVTEETTEPTEPTEPMELTTAPPQATPERHPCQRTCEEGKPMTCSYKFNVEYYFTMSKACYNCPYSMTDCYLKDCIAGDGVERTILVVNKMLPGPAIDVCHGDTVEVEMNNMMLDISTTIHWHGLLQKETPFMDGVPFVSQCLVPPQESFLYRFYADNPGTHLWHAHSALQRGDGIYGALIIRVPPKNDPHLKLYDFDLPEHVVTLLDWNHVLSSDKFISHYLSKGDNKPPSILVNGKGRFKEFRDGEEIIFTPAEKFTVKRGMRYRFRVINAGFLNCPVEMTVDNHNITVIASDGGNLEPVEATTLVTVAGERFDFILEANQEVGNYWIRFRGLLDGSVKKAFQVAILHYEGANENEEPPGSVTYDTPFPPGLKVNAVNTPAGTEGALVISELSHLEKGKDPVLKPEPDVKFYLAYDFYPVENSHFSYPTYANYYKMSRTPQINHISMQFPNFPVMANLTRASTLPVCNGSSISMDCRFEFCECPHVLTVPLNAVVEIVFIDEGVPFDANHPFHLHGYNFKLLGVDRLGSSTSEEEVRRLDREGLLKRNLVNPPVKDTLTIPDGGYAIVRFHATNPGFWILHCHLDFHVEMGMALLFKIGEETDFKSPPPNLPICGDPFRPVPVNQTKDIRARVFPTKGIYNVKKNLNTTASTTSQLQFSFCVLVLLALPLVIV